MLSYLTALALLVAPHPTTNPATPPVKGGMKLVRVITGRLNPKSVVHSGSGLFFAQNMMYLHTIAVYDRNFNRVRTISDQIEPAKLGYPQYQGKLQGGPVECAFSEGGKIAWVSNYQMYGRGFNNPGSDNCDGAGKHDPSFLYKIETQTGRILAIARVGSVPKYVAVTPDNRYVLVTNWCSYDLSVVDASTCREVRRIKLGRYPRGIVVDPSSTTAYIAIFGGTDVAALDLRTFRVSWIRGVGSSPRHLVLDPSGNTLYATLNGDGKVAKIDLKTRRVVVKAVTGRNPRSMTISSDGVFLYVVNNGADTMSKVRASDMRVLQTIKTNHHPIGITYDAQTHRIWVACYTTGLMVFQDQ